MALPDGVPETIKVVCNGVYGTFVVRTKTVVDHNWQEDSVAKFSALCGKSHQQWRHHVAIVDVGVRLFLACRLDAVKFCCLAMCA